MTLFSRGLVCILSLLLVVACGTEAKVSPRTAEHTSTPSSATPTPPINPSHGDTWRRPADGMVMVYVPAGQFEMGYSDAQVEEILRMYSDGQREWYEDEQPAHAVALDAFWIDRTEVTNAQFCEFLNKHGNQREEGISWLEPGAGHGGKCMV